MIADQTETVDDTTIAPMQTLTNADDDDVDF